MGSWLTYGLGTENQNLPGFVVLCPGLAGGRAAAVELRRFCPPSIRARTFRTTRKTPDKLIQYIRNPESARDAAAPRARSAGEAEPDPHAARRATIRSWKRSIQSAEIAFRMQTEAPDAFDITQGNREDARALWRQRFRPRLPDGAAPGGARRAHGAGLLRQLPALGQSRRHHDPSQAGRADADRADRGAAARPEGAAGCWRKRW